ncbi:pentapeptide repeat-containing protein [Streptomyces chrestomyceticus]|uniref:pentapeptide repeat-containing protein n=1 Tax=Streptomyces chrestomyceticus TaxID=68185 RepID=UPI0033EF6690
MERTVGVLAAMATLAVAAFTWISISQVNREQELARDAQVTDRYNTAVSNLGNDSQDVRLGGIYALQRIMQDSRRDYPTVIDVLCAYVRAHATAPRAGATQPQRPANDVSAALRVFRNRDAEPGSDRLIPDLSGTYLRGVSLRGANLTNADLTRANLAGADLRNEQAPLITRGGDQERLRTTDLTNANLYGANLVNADLRGTKLHEADLRAARLHGAKLEGVNLYGAWMTGVDLRGAYLGSARLSEALLTKAALGRANLADAHLNGAVLDGADLSGAGLRRADLRGAHLNGTKLTGADLRGADLRDGPGYGAHAARTDIDVPALLQARLDRTVKLPDRLANDARVRKVVEATASAEGG